MLLMLVGVFLFSADHSHDHELPALAGRHGRRARAWSLAAEIDHLASLRDRGDLSVDEFAVAKSRVLAGLDSSLVTASGGS